MKRALLSDQVPNLLILQYSDDWLVKNLLLVPSFFFSDAAIQKRPPLASTARRAGWVGCNIVLSKIADEGKIRLVVNEYAVPAEAVRAAYNRVRRIARLPVRLRGWTLDVLRLIRGIGSAEFDLNQVYSFEGELSSLHPNNLNIRPKIRQQLQVLRDLGFVQFLGRGTYVLKS